MMYGNKLAAAVKVNGKVLREFKDTVYIPFGSEYTLLIKNLETRRATVNVFIDGDNVVPGGLVLNAGQEIDLQRSLANGNLTEGNALKFIERTSGIEQHRGVKLEDGLIRIEYQFEMVYRPLTYADNNWSNSSWNRDRWDQKFYGHSEGYTVNAVSGSTLRGMTHDSHPGAVCSSTYSTVTPQAMNVSATVSDVGITVPGSKSTQQFSSVGWFPTEAEKYTLVFKLVGDLGDNKPIDTPVTVKHKVKCSTCGKQNKANAKYCAECGTALEIF